MQKMARSGPFSTAVENRATLTSTITMLTQFMQGMEAHGCLRQQSLVLVVGGDKGLGVVLPRLLSGSIRIALIH